MPLVINQSGDLDFAGTHTEASAAVLRLVNTGPQRVAFRIRTQLPKEHRIKPCHGFLNSERIVNVQVTYTPREGTDLQNVTKRNILMVQSVVVSEACSDTSKQFWEQYVSHPDDVQQNIVQCQFTSNSTMPLLQDDTQVSPVEEKGRAAQTCASIQLIDEALPAPLTIHAVTTVIQPAVASEMQSSFKAQPSRSSQANNSKKVLHRLLRAPLKRFFYKMPPSIQLPDMDHSQNEYTAHVEMEESTPRMSVHTGDLTEIEADVIVVADLSTVLLESVWQKMNEMATNQHETLASPKIYILPWQHTADLIEMHEAIEKFVTDAMKRAVNEQHRTIAFVVIVCDQACCLSSLVTRAMVQEVHSQLHIYPLSVLFVISPQQANILDQVQEEIQLLPNLKGLSNVQWVSLAVGQGCIVLEKEDLQVQKVDVIVRAFQSGKWREATLQAAIQAGEDVNSREFAQRLNKPLVSIPSDQPAASRIYLVHQPFLLDLASSRAHYAYLLSTILQQATIDGFTSVALPMVVFDDINKWTEFRATLLLACVHTQLTVTNAAMLIKLIAPQSEDDGFIFRVAFDLVKYESAPTAKVDVGLPSTWENGADGQRSFPLDPRSQEYHGVLSKFSHTERDFYHCVLRIVRIQNEPCYLQFIALRQAFHRQMEIPVEAHLFHSCSEAASALIINHGFHPRFLEAHGATDRGYLFFTSGASLAHRYSTPNASGERRMFLSRALIGKVHQMYPSGTKRTSNGFHTFLGDDHVFTTPYSTQAYADYLIVYR